MKNLISCFQGILLTLIDIKHFQQEKDLFLFLRIIMKNQLNFLHINNSMNPIKINMRSNNNSNNNNNWQRNN